MPVCVLIPIRVLACPLPVMGICAFWYQHILRHQLLERIVQVTESEDSKEAILAKLNQLNREGEQYMRHAEKK
jgi:hypothetical protein